MMKTGIMIFHEEEQAWRIWIGNEAFEALYGMNLEIYVGHRYYQAVFDSDHIYCFVTIEDEVDFALRLVETYKIRVREEKLIPAMYLPF